MKDDKERNAEKDVKKFQQEFYKKYGVRPKVVYELENPELIPLEIIANAAGAILNKIGSQYYLEGIRSVLNDKDILLCRQVYYLLATNNGHRYIRSAKYLKQCAPNSKHAVGRISSLLAEGDDRTIRIYKLIKEELDRLTFKAIDNV
jgi:hypothetical protein